MLIITSTLVSINLVVIIMPDVFDCLGLRLFWPILTQVVLRFVGQVLGLEGRVISLGFEPAPRVGIYLRCIEAYVYTLINLLQFGIGKRALNT